MSVIDPLGLRRCSSCQNAFEYDRQPDGRCGHCGGPFDEDGRAGGSNRERHPPPAPGPAPAPDYCGCCGGLAAEPPKGEHDECCAELHDAVTRCPLCGGELVPLGRLGRVDWARCRDCGTDVHGPEVRQ